MVDRGQPAMPGYRQIPALDGIRGFAIALVVGLHLGYILDPKGLSRGETYVPGGFAGVDVFFVLSGYLITSLLLGERQRNGEISLRGFYARRALRLLPALAVLLIAHLGLALARGLSLRGEAVALSSITFYSSDITQSLHMYMPLELSHTWSLAVEEQFYLVWPAALIFLSSYWTRRAQQRRWVVPLTLVAALVMIVVVRVVVWRTMGYPAAYYLPFCHSDGLVIGVMLAFLHARGFLLERRAALYGWVALIGLLLFAFLWEENSSLIYYGGFTVLSLAAAALINAVLLERPSITRVLSTRPLMTIGRVSYGLYLWHGMVLLYLLNETFGLGRWTRAGLGLTVTAAGTAASWILVEKPALRMKGRFTPTKPFEELSDRERSRSPRPSRAPA